MIQNTTTKKIYIYVKFLDKINNDNLVKIHTTNPKILDNIHKQQNDWIKLKVAQVSLSVNDSVFADLSARFAPTLVPAPVPVPVLAPAPAPAPAPIGVASAPSQAPNTASGSSSDDTSTNKRIKLS